MSKAPRTVIFLRLGERSEFFTTPAALYAEHTVEELGITRQSLNNYFSKLGSQEVKTYKNDRCEIIKGELRTNSKKEE